MVISDIISSLEEADSRITQQVVAIGTDPDTRVIVIVPTCSLFMLSEDVTLWQLHNYGVGKTTAVNVAPKGSTQAGSSWKPDSRLYAGGEATYRVHGSL